MHDRTMAIDVRNANGELAIFPSDKLKCDAIGATVVPLKAYFLPNVSGFGLKLGPGRALLLAFTIDEAATNFRLQMKCLNVQTNSTDDGKIRLSWDNGDGVDVDFPPTGALSIIDINLPDPPVEPKDRQLTIVSSDGLVVHRVRIDYSLPFLTTQDSESDATFTLESPPRDFVSTPQTRSITLSWRATVTDPTQLLTVYYLDRNGRRRFVPTLVNVPAIQSQLTHTPFTLTPDIPDSITLVPQFATQKDVDDRSKAARTALSGKPWFEENANQFVIRATTLQPSDTDMIRDAMSGTLKATVLTDVSAVPDALERLAELPLERVQLAWPQAAGEDADAFLASLQAISTLKELNFDLKVWANRPFPKLTFHRLSSLVLTNVNDANLAPTLQALTCPNLRLLSINGDELTDSGFATCDIPRSIEHFALDSKNIGNPIPTIARALPDLRRLHVNRCLQFTDETFAGVSQLTKLEQIALPQPCHVLSLDHLVKCSRLESIHLWENTALLDESNAATKLSRFPELRNMTIRVFHLSADSVKQLLTAPKLDELTLEVANDRINYTGNEVTIPDFSPSSFSPSGPPSPIKETAWSVVTLAKNP